ncbi:MAG: calcium-binding protein, partial [Alphaproteobacteria bacterium]|nr:calcium-binding protein [Alphaproteobacteria bacterium]
DTFNGGAGTDTIRNIGTGDMYFNAGTTLNSIEAIDGNGLRLRFDDPVTIDFSGYTLTNISELYAGNGNDTITGSAGNDTFRGRNGTDILNGGNGNDVFRVYGGEGRNDTFNGGAGTDVLRNGGTGDIYLNNATSLISIEEIDGNGARLRFDDAITIDFTSYTLTNISSIWGSGSADNITGNGADNTFRGRGGTDILNGGGGNDTFEVSGTEARNDTFNGGSGTDTIENIHATNGMYFNNNTVFNSIEIIEGNNNRIEIDSNTTIDFTSITLNNVSEIRGSNGINDITGSTGDDIINGRNGNDILDGGDGNDTIDGGANNDILYGGNGDDLLSATSGTNSFYGEDGFDIMTAGTGTDTFVFEAASAYNDVDEINSFGSVIDILDISDLLTNWTTGHPTRGDITNYLNFVDSGSDTLVQIDSNGNSGGSSFTTIGQINGLTGLDEATLYGNGQIIVP